MRMKVWIGFNPSEKTTLIEALTARDEIEVTEVA